MSITIKTPAEQDAMRAAGRAAASVLEHLASHVKPGVTTSAINDAGHAFVQSLGCVPAPLGYGATRERPPFPKSLCTSVNHVVCHGIPGDKPLKKGDIVNVDVTVIKDGFHGDTSYMFTVGEPGVLAKRLVNVFHEDPQVLHYGRPGTGIELEEGMTFTIEPMVNAGRHETRLLPDGWTVVTKDHSLSAQWEHTVLVTRDGVEVLTRRADEVL